MKEVLAIKHFRLFLFSQIISTLGDQLRIWAIYFWVFTASGQSPLAQAMVLLSEVGPTVLLGPLVGPWVDRLNRRDIALVSAGVRGLLSALILVAMLSGSVPLALAGLGLSAIAEQFFRPAVGAVVIAMVPPEQLMAASSLAHTTQTFLALLGPALGTGIYQLVGPQAALGVDAVSFWVAAILLFMIPRTVGQLKEKSAGDYWAELREGWRYGWTNATVRTIFLVFTIMSLAIGAVNAMSIFLVTDAIHLSKEWLGWGATIQGVGMLIAAIITGMLSKGLRALNWAAVGMIGLLALGFGLLASAHSAGMLLGGRFVVGLGVAALNIVFTTMLGLAVSEQFQGRIGATIESAPTAAMLISAPLAAYLVRLTDVRSIFIGASALMAMAGLWAMAGFRHAPSAHAPHGEISMKG